jgi:hypothetical protein
LPINNNSRLVRKCHPRESRWHYLNPLREVTSANTTHHINLNKEITVFVYLNGNKERRNSSHFLHVAPAFAPIEGLKTPSHWLDRDGNPETLKVEFKFGAAEVENVLGEWLISTGTAQRGNLRQTGRSLLGSLAATIAGR